jgi:hypothetical protein
MFPIDRPTGDSSVCIVLSSPQTPENEEYWRKSDKNADYSDDCLGGYCHIGWSVLVITMCTDEVFE